MLAMATTGGKAVLGSGLNREAVIGLVLSRPT